MKDNDVNFGYHLVAGGFGFIGQYLVWRLLKQGKNVLLLGRAGTEEKMQQRIDILKENNLNSGEAYKLLPKDYQKLEVIHADIGEDKLGMSQEAYEKLYALKIEAIWNTAAYMKYDREALEQSMQVNVDGSARLLDLVAHNHDCRYNHVSTAFAGGRSMADGTEIKERIYDNIEYFNSYDYSKAQAEKLVAEVCEKQNLKYTIYRPAIVIGDSETGFTSSSFGFYEYARLMNVLARKKIHDTVMIACQKDSPVNIIPVDICVNEMLEIANHDGITSGQIFTIADSSPLPFREVITMMSSVFRLNVIPCSREEFGKAKSTLNRFIARATARNSVFANSDIRFSTDNASKILGHPVAVRWVKDKAFFKKITEAFNQYLAQHA